MDFELRRNRTGHPCLCLAHGGLEPWRSEAMAWAEGERGGNLTARGWPQPPNGAGGDVPAGPPSSVAQDAPRPLRLEDVRHHARRPRVQPQRCLERVDRLVVPAQLAQRGPLERPRGKVARVALQRVARVGEPRLWPACPQMHRRPPCEQLRVAGVDVERLVERSPRGEQVVRLDRPLRRAHQLAHLRARVRRQQRQRRALRGRRVCRRPRSTEQRHERLEETGAARVERVRVEQRGELVEGGRSLGSV
mmetsp:Transcript_40686/g.128287  ORF Transcript_40686/g.128287 Transcript_40686/m.128287 type:complete len:249 (+) Transcript_40686:57-803(+)